MQLAPTTLQRIAVAAAVLAGIAVLAAAGGGAGAGAAPPAHAAKTYRLSADSGGDLRFSRTRVTASRGSVTLRLSNPSPLDHGIAIQGRKKGRTAGPGGVSTVTVTLKAGTYTFYCPVDGHRAGGMKGKLVVR